MTIKKGIVVKRIATVNGSKEIKEAHKLVDTGVFELGMDIHPDNSAATDNIKLQGRLDIAGPVSDADATASDVNDMIDKVDDAIAELAAKEMGTVATGTTGTDYSSDAYEGYNDIDTKLTTAETQIGVSDAGDRTMSASVWSGTTAIESATQAGYTSHGNAGSNTALQAGDDTFKKVDERLALEIDAANTGVSARITTLNADENTANSVKNLIAGVVFTDDQIGSYPALVGDATTVIDTIWEIQKAFHTGTLASANATDWAGLDTVDTALLTGSIKANILSYINEAELDLKNGVSEDQDTLEELEWMINTERGGINDAQGTNVTGRYADKDLVLRQALETSMASAEIVQADGGGAMPVAMNETGSVTFATAYANTAAATLTARPEADITGVASFKAADEALDAAISLNRVDLNTMESHLNLAGALTVHTATLTGLQFGADAGQLSLPSMTAREARALFGANTNPNTDHNGKMVFITDVDSAGSNDDDGATAEFTQSNKFYFCEEGRWLPSSFVKSSE